MRTLCYVTGLSRELAQELGSVAPEPEEVSQKGREDRSLKR